MSYEVRITTRAFEDLRSIFELRQRLRVEDRRVEVLAIRHTSQDEVTQADLG